MTLLLRLSKSHGKSRTDTAERSSSWKQGTRASMFPHSRSSFRVSFATSDTSVFRVRKKVVDVEIGTLRRLNNNLNVEPFCFPLHCKHTCIDLFWLWANAYHSADAAAAGRLLYEIWALLRSTRSFKLFLIFAPQCYAPGLYSGDILSRNCYASPIISRTPRFWRIKSLSEQRTTLRLVFVWDRSLTCLSNADRKTITRTQKRNKALLNGGSTLTHTHTLTHPPVLSCRVTAAKGSRDPITGKLEKRERERTRRSMTLQVHG